MTDTPETPHESPLTESELDAARQLLAAENNGTEIIQRDSDGAVFIRNIVAARTIATLTRSLAEARHDEGHWKANHDHIKERIRVLLDRPDLPQPRKHVLDYFDKREAELKRSLTDAEAERDAARGVSKQWRELHEELIGLYPKITDAIKSAAGAK